MMNCSVEPYTPHKDETIEMIAERNSANLALMALQGHIPGVVPTEHDLALIRKYGLTPEA